MTHVRLAGVSRVALAAFYLGSAAAFAQPAPAESGAAITPRPVQTQPLAPPPATAEPAPQVQPAPPQATATPAAPATPPPAQGTTEAAPAQPAPTPPQTPPSQTPPQQAAPGEAVPPPTGAQHPDAITGEMTVLNPMPVLTRTGTSSWAEGFDNIVLALDAITAQMGKLGLKRAGEAMIVYTSSDEAGFEYEAQIPFSGESTEAPGDDVKIGASFSGRVMKFHHSGSFADMDTTYEGVANFLDARNVEAQNFYIERYLTDPATSEPDALEVDIFVPVR